jgi:tRNA(Ile)-lysidine synthase
VKAIIEKVGETIKQHRLLKRGDSVLVALSGGPDSVALLHLLCEFKAKYRINLAVAHLDHGIRRESASEREFCRRLCRRLKVKFHSKKVNVPALSEKTGLSLEEAGRQARYDYFDCLCQRFGYSRVATGHTADDSVETIIFNMIRGSGLRGIAGIPAKRGKIIRPLIDIGKDEIVRWLKASRIEYIIDRTNLSTAFARNMIRRRIIPQLEKLNPKARRNILRMAKIAAEEVEFTDSVAVSVFEKALMQAGKSKIALDLGKLRGYDRKLRKRVIGEAYVRLNGSRTRPLSESLERAAGLLDGRYGARAPLGRNIWIEKSHGRIFVFKEAARRKEIPLTIPGMTEIPDSGVLLEAEILRRSQVKRLKTDPDTALLDYESVKNAVVRFWRKGDRIRPFGMRGRRLLSDVFTDRKIPSLERGEKPLVVVDGNIAWVAGVMISDDFKVGPETKEVLRIRACGL